MLTAVLLIVAAEQISAPAPFLRADDRRGRIDGFDLAGIVQDFVSDFVHGRACRMDVAMGRVPEARFIIENVITQPASGRRAPFIDERTNPILLIGGVGGDASVVETYISYLRRKVDVEDAKLIHTIRGVGYVLKGS